MWNLTIIVGKGGHLSVKTNRLDKSVRPNHLPANTYSDGYGFIFLEFFGFGHRKIVTNIEHKRGK